MKIRFTVIAFCCYLAAFPHVSFTQQPRPSNAKPQPGVKADSKDQNSTDAENRGRKQQELRLKEQTAEMLISRAAEEAGTLEDRRSAVRIQGTAAAVLWNRDKEYGRTLFRRAFDSAVSSYREGKDSVPVTRTLLTSRPDLRLEIIQLVNRCDAALGRQFMEQYVEERQHELKEQRGIATGPSDSAFGKVDVTATDYLKIAESQLEVDQQAAFQTAQRAFSTGIPQAAGYFFTVLAARNQQAADQMYRLALAQLRQDSAPMPGQLLLLSAYPFGDNRVWVAGIEGLNMYGFEVPKNFIVNKELIQMFLEVALVVLIRVADSDLSQFPDAASRLGSGLFAARLLQSKVAEFQPQLLPEWNTVTAKLMIAARNTSREVDQALDQVAETKQSASTSDARGDRIRQMLKRAESTQNSASRDDLYWEAASQADKLDDTAWALDIANEIGDLDFRHTVQSVLHFNAAERALKDKRYDDAQQLALRVDPTDQQVYLFLEIARALKDKSRPRAVDLIDKSVQRATSAPNGPERLRALLGITYFCASFDPFRSFEVGTEAVQAANKVPTYDSDEARLFITVESRTRHSSTIEIKHVEGFDLGKTFGLLALIDFDRALGLVQSLDSKPLRLASLVTVAGTVLDKTEREKRAAR